MSGARVLLASFTRAPLSNGVLYPISPKEALWGSLVSSGTWVEALISTHRAHSLTFRESIGDVLKPGIFPRSFIVGARAWLILSGIWRALRATREEGCRSAVVRQAIISMVVSRSKVPIASSAVSLLPHGVLDGIGAPDERFVVIVLAWSWLVL